MLCYGKRGANGAFQRMKCGEGRCHPENQTIRLTPLLSTGLPARLSNKVIQSSNLTIIGLLDEQMCMKLLSNLVNHFRTKKVCHTRLLDSA